MYDHVEVSETIPPQFYKAVAEIIHYVQSRDAPLSATEAQSGVTVTFTFETDLDRYAGVLAQGLQRVAEDLRTIDLIDVVSYIRFGSYATIEDLLQSSTEMFFKHGALSFAWTAGVEMAWGEQPTISVGMEFRHAAVTVFFDLLLRANDNAVKIAGILFEEPRLESADKVQRLRDAIAEARLPAKIVVAAARQASAGAGGAGR